jgi:hypothetical protein
MIIKYNEFLTESKYDEIESEYHSIGEYIEDVSKDNEYLSSIVANYIKESDTDIRISNAVNILNDFNKKQLFYRVYNFLQNGEKDKESVVMTDVIVENVQQVKAGKNMFTSFLKCITALGSKNITKSENPQEEFLLFYNTKNIDVVLIKSVFQRFKSLSMFLEHMDYTFNEVSLYFGIKNNCTFEYGFFTDKRIPIGHFTLNKSNLYWLLVSTSPSASALKKDIVNLDIKKLIIFGKVANKIKNFTINAESKKGPIINDDVISFGYYGIGKWDNGKLDDGEFQNLKSNFKTWLMKYKWSQSILVSITYSSFWVYFNIKVK